MEEMKTMKKIMYAMAGLIFLWAGATPALAADRQILGVTFSEEKVVEGKTLKLNGVAYRKALGIVKVYVVGLYLENPTKDPQQIIESEQIKHMVFHYLTDKATAKKLSEGFVEAIEKCNPPELVNAHKDEIQTYASWLDKDMKPGLTSVSTYLPGKGLTLVYQDEPRGTIPGKEFAQMYYRYNLGEKADKNIRQGLLGQ
jgi:hypothetical protein